MEKQNKQEMENLFLSYKESLSLKELGFNELCFAYFKDEEFQYPNPYEPFKNSEMKSWCITTPLYSQAFKFFRNNYKLESEFKKLEEGYTFHCFKNQEELVKSISKLFDDDRKKYVYQTYEKAELECIKQLIKIVKENGKN